VSDTQFIKRMPIVNIIDICNLMVTEKTTRYHEYDFDCLQWEKCSYN